MMNLTSLIFQTFSLTQIQMHAEKISTFRMQNTDYGPYSMIQDPVWTIWYGTYIEHNKNRCHRKNQDERCCPEKCRCVTSFTTIWKVTKAYCSIDYCKFASSMDTRIIVLTWLTSHRIIAHSYFVWFLQISLQHLKINGFFCFHG